MATQEAIATIRANALRVLKETGAQIAAEVGIETPQLDFFFPDKSYQQAQELTVLAAFNERLLAALQTSEESEEGEPDEPASSPQSPKRRSTRRHVSQR